MDPLQLDVGASNLWFDRKSPQYHRIRWYPGNFTDENGNRLSSLKLALWGYKEFRDDRDKKFVPVLEKIGILNSAVSNQQNQIETGEIELRFNAQTPQWTENGERNFWSYRFGFLRLYVDDNMDSTRESAGYVYDSLIKLIAN